MTHVEIIKEGEVKPKPKKKGRADVPEAKKALVKKLVDLIDKNNIIAMVNMQNLPAKQLGSMRSQLRGKVDLIMTKKRFIKIALETSKKPHIKELEKHIAGMPALLFTDQNPFTLFKLIKKNKSQAPIKAGQKAPNDLVIPAGPTSFSPGPIIGELGSFKIKAGIEDGKVAIKEDSVVAKEGEVVSDKLAALLTRMGIEPMEIGLNIVAVYEKGEILLKDVLDVDEEKYISDLKTAATEAFNLVMFIALPNKDTIEPLISKAHREARAVAKEANVMTSDNVGEVLAKAEAEASALKEKVPNVPKEAPKPEEKKEEASPAPEDPTESKKDSEVSSKMKLPKEKKEEKPKEEKKDNAHNQPKEE